MTWDGSVDALADQHYAPYNPEYADPEEEERADIRAALDEVIELLETTRDEIKALKQNFQQRKYNKYIYALEEMEEEIREAKEDV